MGAAMVNQMVFTHPAVMKVRGISTVHRTPGCQCGVLLTLYATRSILKCRRTPRLPHPHSIPCQCSLGRPNPQNGHPKNNPVSVRYCFHSLAHQLVFDFPQELLKIM